MDDLLLEIKNFLEKLESGQLDIEAGQWELHKDISNMKKAVEELNQLKEDFEMMKMNSKAQMGMIKSLRLKLEGLNKRHKKGKTVAATESSIEGEKVLEEPKKPPKNPKKRKLVSVSSEEIVDECRSTKKSGSDNVSGEDCMGSEKEETNNEPSSTECSDLPEYDKHYGSKAGSKHSKIPHQTSETKNDILQRYLKDSVKYRGKKSCHSNGKVYPPIQPRSSRQGVDYQNVWNDYTTRLPYDKEMSQTSGASVKTVESILPKRILRMKNQKKVAFKENPPTKERHSRRIKPLLFCKTCAKCFKSKSLLKSHEASHKRPKTKEKGLKCSYCEKICATPEKLTRHLRNCRIIMRSHFKRR